jgi:hypothetical protein
MEIAEIQSVFAVGPFSPIWSDYGSIVYGDRLIEANHRQEILREQLEAKARRWQVAAMSMFSCGAIAMFVSAWLWLNKSRS